MHFINWVIRSGKRREEKNEYKGRRGGKRKQGPPPSVRCRRWGKFKSRS